MGSLRTLAGPAALTLALAMTLVGVGPASGQSTWKAPASAKGVKNPVSRSKESIDAGAKLAKLNCAPCHGEKGKGDGPGAAALPNKPADWTAKAVQDETDGEIFWKISKGNPPMPPWESLPEKDRWNLVNYIRSLSAKK